MKTLKESRQEIIQKGLTRALRVGLPFVKLSHAKLWSYYLLYCQEVGLSLNDETPTYITSPFLENIKEKEELKKLLKKWFCYNFVTKDNPDQTYTCIAKLIDGTVLKEVYPRIQAQMFSEEWAMNRFQNLRSMVLHHLNDRHQNTHRNA